MSRKQLILAVCFLGLTLVSKAQEGEVKITSPSDGVSVPRRLLVEGSITNGKDKDQVWVIIHPIETSEYWVQPKISIRGKGNWSGYEYIGEAGKKDVGKHFEIRAVVNPEGSLTEGQKLADWPTAKLKSDVIMVTRNDKDK
jgi:hypothetical protein